jgi:glycosyltransferase involved in cell wall biosynthesis
MPYNPIDLAMMDDLKCCVIIPTYNNDQTLEKLIRDVKTLTGNIIVVNDGSTDRTAGILSLFPEIQTISIPVNTGKGWALRKGFSLAMSSGYDYAITIDSDGQHDPADIPKFIDMVSVEPGCLIVGERNMDDPGVPGTSRFGHKFSVFWFWIETGIKIPDVQSGFRLYPLQRIKEIKHFYSRKYEFEVEVLVRLAWRNVNILSTPVNVCYAPKATRVSHFRKGPDFARTSVMNAVLVFMGLLWVRPFMFIKPLKKKLVKDFLKQYILNSSDSNSKITCSVMTGTFIGIIPVWGWQMMIAFGLAHYFKLNKFITVAASNISIPPFLPFILYLSYLTGGWVLGTKTSALHYSSGFGLQWIKANFIQYVTGSFIFGAFASIVLGSVFYLMLRIFRQKGGK